MGVIRKAYDARGTRVGRDGGHDGIVGVGVGVERDTASSGGLAPKRDSIRVSAKVGDIVVYPLHAISRQLCRRLL